MNDGATPERRPRTFWRVLRVAAITTFTIAGLIAIAAGLAAFLAYDYVTRPGVPGESVQVNIPPGLSGNDIGKLLTQSGLIEHELFFRAAIRLDESHATIKHGPYALPKGLSPTQLLHILHKGPNRPPDPSEMFRLTIPEGLSIVQLAQLFANPEAFLDAVYDPALLKRLPVDTPSPEGFLMPNTYFFPEPPTEQQVVDRMIEQFNLEFRALLGENLHVNPDDTYQILTIASLIEEEARVDDERPLVASVIYNRLERRMTLDMDSTLQFALNKYGQRLLNADKEVDSPYNTYRNRGLPPGPISNPGVASIRAAMNPADSDYLYFVSNADGKTHTFSRTLNEHNSAVARYRREIAQQRRDQAAQQANDTQ